LQCVELGLQFGVSCNEIRDFGFEFRNSPIRVSFIKSQDFDLSCGLVLTNGVLLADKEKEMPFQLGQHFIHCRIDRFGKCGED